MPLVSFLGQLGSCCKLKQRSTKSKYIHLSNPIQNEINSTAGRSVAKSIVELAEMNEWEHTFVRSHAAGACSTSLLR
jgi:hypothetical protein